jgi:hypothetical protein
MPCCRAGTDAGADGAISREALDVATVASRVSIKPGDRPRGEPQGGGPEGERPPVADPPAVRPVLIILILDGNR